MNVADVACEQSIQYMNVSQCDALLLGTGISTLPGTKHGGEKEEGGEATRD